ncbi:MAG TPA: hypothetical protein PLU43_02435, partial [Lachnospiraceae bacterium]|nr:hypothetical protein [Lachnospiraceae bacterium]
IDFTGKSGITPADTDKEMETAEAVAVKSNQEIYLIPNEFLAVSNPVTKAVYSSMTDDPFAMTIPSEQDLAPTDWFGYKYIVKTDSVNGDYVEAEVKTMTRGSVEYKYGYLSFNDKYFRQNGSGIYVECSQTDTGAMNAKAAYFDEIMNASADASSEAQPCAYELKQRAMNTMFTNVSGTSMFDLNYLITGDGSTDFHLYAKNALVNYNSSGKTANVLCNTEGIDRYAGYAQNFNHRYQNLYCYLDAKSDIPISQDPGAVEDSVLADTALPISSYIDVSAIKAAYSDPEDATLDAICTCVIKKVPTYTITGTFSGIAIIDGDIEVESGAKIDGLLAATGTILFKGNNQVTSDRSLIQKRIDKEVELMKSAPEGTALPDTYLIAYLLDSAGNQMYQITPVGEEEAARIDTDYTKFIRYDNWRKGDTVTVY